jgi:Domain of unknown function (DUF4342)
MTMLAHDAQNAPQVLKMLTTRPGSGCRMTGQVSTRGADRDTFTVRRAEAVARVQSAVRQGNVRRIGIKDEDGRTLVEIPLQLGVRGGVRLLPVWAAVAGLASVSAQLTIEVLREAGWPRYED